MIYRKLSLGLGVFSIGLGLAELIAPRRIARALGVEEHEGVVRGFGGREMLSGAAILAAPAASANIWNRLAGDAMDLTSLGLALRASPKRGAVWGAIGFVAAVTALDAVVARGLDRTTGKFLPVAAA
ncbi:hypothetical protein GCM10011380_11600 [Sphingomonas metalli]|uniref:DUF4267 domain-containing protein n=1 Tax=Sphingomonas metalli TaxID=1779358 RepID=A0A916WRQ8_9SPHN|nr:hypothetical protein [Sphingomonas metalli]GGB23554.1 hypothetical protein GCM10011380_11600 [Sphingomonas metalli]